MDVTLKGAVIGLMEKHYNITAHSGNRKLAMNSIPKYSKINLSRQTKSTTKRLKMFSYRRNFYRRTLVTYLAVAGWQIQRNIPAWLPTNKVAAFLLSALAL